MDASNIQEDLISKFGKYLHKQQYEFVERHNDHKDGELFPWSPVKTNMTWPNNALLAALSSANRPVLLRLTCLTTKAMLALDEPAASNTSSSNQATHTFLVPSGQSTEALPWPLLSASSGLLSTPTVPTPTGRVEVSLSI